MYTCQPGNPRSTQAGVGLIEILVAVLVLAIGVLGIAALQARALSNNGSSMGQSMAVVASYSILEAMRADRTNALAGSYNTSSALVANNCPTTNSTLAQYQQQAWCNQLGAALGISASTMGKINCTSSATCIITVQFDDSKGTGGSATQTVIVTAGL